MGSEVIAIEDRKREVREWWNCMNSFRIMIITNSCIKGIHGSCLSVIVNTIERVRKWIDNLIVMMIELVMD